MSHKDFVQVEDFVVMVAKTDVFQFCFDGLSGPNHLDATDCDLLVNAYLDLQTLIQNNRFVEHHLTVNDAYLLIEATSSHAGQVHVVTRFAAPCGDGYSSIETKTTVTEYCEEWNQMMWSIRTELMKLI